MSKVVVMVPLEFTWPKDMSKEEFITRAWEEFRDNGVSVWSSSGFRMRSPKTRKRDFVALVDAAIDAALGGKK